MQVSNSLRKTVVFTSQRQAMYFKANKHGVFVQVAVFSCGTRKGRPRCGSINFSRKWNRIGFSRCYGSCLGVE